MHGNKPSNSNTVEIEWAQPLVMTLNSFPFLKQIAKQTMAEHNVFFSYFVLLVRILNDFILYRVEEMIFVQELKLTYLHPKNFLQIHFVIWDHIKFNTKSAW